MAFERFVKRVGLGLLAPSHGEPLTGTPGAAVGQGSQPPSLHWVPAPLDLAVCGFSKRLRQPLGGGQGTPRAASWARVQPPAGVCARAISSGVGFRATRDRLLRQRVDCHLRQGVQHYAVPALERIQTPLPPAAAQLHRLVFLLCPRRKGRKGRKGRILVPASAPEPRSAGRSG